MIENQKSAVIISWIVLLKAIRVICKSNVTFMSVVPLRVMNFQILLNFPTTSQTIALFVSRKINDINKYFISQFYGIEKTSIAELLFSSFLYQFWNKMMFDTQKKTENKYWFCYNLFIGHLHRNYLLFFEIIKICDFVEVFGYKNGHSPKIDRV